MDSSIVLIGLPIALGIIMFGLGLDLTPADFARVAQRPKAAIVALTCQLIVLPLVCFGLCLAFNLPPLLAVGMMLLAASPGGTTANLYSHLFRGDVALNISLTAINSVIAVFTLPIIVNLSVAYFQPGDMQVGLQFRKTLEVFLIVLVPVMAGMAVRRMRPAFAKAMDKPVRLASILILTLVILGAALSGREALLANLGSLVGIVVAFCLLSLSLGFAIPRLLRIDRAQSIASSFEVGLHNATLAIVIAQSVLQSPQMTLPAAIYGVLMFPLAAAFGFILTRQRTALGSRR
ncbi:MULTISPECIES: bile acid:sodium symporter family protein [unclassified Brevundimonas]|uniref:bile acid:sodium symporter family protein n=1 Tax=unclassified Brevundimonas TaxID=2622653 RepID=UPI0025B9902E|nr:MULTISPECIES: bile acid:sodium symporter family protein [unclassified Brevundimonas]